MAKIKNILFDLGGVLYHINYQLTIDAFEKLGAKNFHKHFSQIQQSSLFDKLETGKISEEVFIVKMKILLPNCSKKEILHAWNALLIGMPKENIDLLSKVSKNYKVFLLSNTNTMHIKHIYSQINKKYGLRNLSSLFTKVYLSHEIGKRKPNKETFDWVLKDAGILAKETLFVDDSIQHIESANDIGIKTLKWESNKPICRFFPDIIL